MLMDYVHFLIKLRQMLLMFRDLFLQSREPVGEINICQSDELSQTYFSISFFRT